MIAYRVWNPTLRRLLLTTRMGRLALVLPRFLLALRASGVLTQVRLICLWALGSRDIAPRSYDTTRLNQDDLCWTVATVSGRPVQEVMGYRDEIVGDAALADYIRTAVEAGPERWSHDPEYRLGRRLVYYLLIRALKPERVFEAGVDRGYGAVLILRALERNAADGVGGDYVGADSKGEDDAFLYTGYPGRQGPGWTGKVERGDAVALLQSYAVGRALVIHDTTADLTHVEAFLTAAETSLGAASVLLSGWTVAPFLEFAHKTGRAYTSHQDNPVAHWGRGNRLSIVFPRR